MHDAACLTQHARQALLCQHHTCHISHLAPQRTQLALTFENRCLSATGAGDAEIDEEEDVKEEASRRMPASEASEASGRAEASVQAEAAAATRTWSLLVAQGTVAVLLLYSGCTAALLLLYCCFTACLGTFCRVGECCVSFCRRGRVTLWGGGGGAPPGGGGAPRREEEREYGRDFGRSCCCSCWLKLCVVV